MASELQVTTLKGNPTGANANKIVIPSGQTLDVGEGTIAPSVDQIVQHKMTKPTALTTFSSGSYTDATGFALAITPKYASSKILIRVWAKVGQNNSASGNSAQDNRLTRNGTQIYNSQWTNYLNSNWATSDFYIPFTLSYIDEPNTTSLITYKLQGRLYGGGQLGWTINDANGGEGIAAMEVLEIKQ
jgi:hypothetical protein